MKRGEGEYRIISGKQNFFITGNGESSICQFIKDRNGELVRSRKKLRRRARK